MDPLSEAATLGDLQRYVAQMEVERGLNGRDVVSQCLQLVEEVGELAKAIRKREQMPIDRNSHVGTVPEELADVTIFIAAIANRYGIDLEDALRQKETRNEKRVWVQGKGGHNPRQMSGG